MSEFNKGRNIVLIGMAACGKSTVGILVAEALGLTFIDTDLIIQQQYGKLLGPLLEEVGSEDFIQKESDAIRSLDCTNCCISTGGSAVYSDRAMNFLKQKSEIVFIDISYPNIMKRLAGIDIQNRGIVIEQGKTLFDVYNERKILYEKYADYTVEADDKSVEDLVMEIAGIYNGKIRNLEMN